MSGIQIDGVNNKIDFDDDQDTSISANTDDTLVVEVGGTNIATVTATSVTFNDGVEIIVDDNSNALKLTCTDADATNGPTLRLARDSASPADNDFIGRVLFSADNDAGEETNIYEIKAGYNDVSDGTEDGMVRHSLMVGGTLSDVMTLDSTIVVFNDASNDIDFRVESNNNSNMFKVDAGDDRSHYGGTSYQGMSLGVHNFHSGTTTDQSGIVLGSNSASYANNLFKIGCLRDQVNAYSFITCFTGNSSNDLDDDLEFRVKGDGNVSCDESFTGSGADYAEYFEWKDGNASDEDRVGISVKLDGNKIVPSSDSDNASDIIGVVSGSPVIVGDADGTGARWTQKYLKDDYGRKLKEEYTVTTWRDEANKEDHSYATDRIPSDVTVPSDAKVTTTELDGVTKLLRPKINPDYDKTKTYVSREDRKEWDTVGLMGKLRLRKGQPTGTNWIKMRDISDTVEEWLVR